MPSRELFLSQPSTFQNTIIPTNAKLLIVEAGVRTGWEVFSNPGKSFISIDRFGISGSGEEVAERLGISFEKIVIEAKKLMPTPESRLNYEEDSL
jgi:transketolase